MGHMLATVNREAADEIDHPTPLPDIGSTVVYIPRAGQVRAGKTRVPAIVTGRDVDNRLLDLVVIYDADDFLSKPRIPRRQGDDHGWELVGAAPQGRSSELQTFKDELGSVLFGDNAKPPTNFTDELMEIRRRLDAIEGVSEIFSDIGGQLKNLNDRLIALETKRGPGRPPNAPAAENKG